MMMLLICLILLEEQSPESKQWDQKCTVVHWQADTHNYK